MMKKAFSRMFFHTKKPPHGYILQRVVRSTALLAKGTLHSSHEVERSTEMQKGTLCNKASWLHPNHSLSPVPANQVASSSPSGSSSGALAHVPNSNKSQHGESSPRQRQQENGAKLFPRAATGGGHSRPAHTNIFTAGLYLFMQRVFSLQPRRSTSKSNNGPQNCPRRLGALPESRKLEEKTPPMANQLNCASPQNTQSS
ncbi:unnamed protein product [Ostreobium quekettii]|uniref:Uncharacterized protein n=1 Tax=Ostreobium quekettii TaxID=121088 RepID=A0A8S1IPA8_9CHLO|nr:unnamed protein product [Ostreobium quekettii]